MKIKENLEKAKEMENTIQKLKAKLQQKSMQDIELTEKEEEFKKVHKNAINKIKVQFQKAMKALQQKNENYENEIRELEKFIKNRPSRNEDLEQIEELKKALEMRKKENEELKDIINSNNIKLKTINSKSKGSKLNNANSEMIYSKNTID